MTNAQGIAVPADGLSALVARLFTAAGVSGDSARTVAQALVDADLDGQYSHGVMLVEMYLDRLRNGSVSTSDAGSIVSDQDAAVVIDAGNALGHLTGDQAMTLAVERARAHGAGIVAVRNGFHFGTARRFAGQAAEAGCIGIAMCNTRPLMPAPGGAERLVGNNPLAIAVPSAGEVPIVLDMATSEAAMGKIRMAAKAGQSIPDSWAVTADGEATTDPAAAIAGMLLPTGGPKGFGLAFIIDLMCGLLSDGGSGAAVQPLYGDPAVPYNSAHLFIAIDVAHFGDPDAVRAAAAAAAKRVQASRTAPGVARVFVPGEPEWHRRQEAAGQVSLSPAVAETLVRLADEMGVPAQPLGTDGSTKQEPGNVQA